MKYKIIAGPTQMIVRRFGYKSEPIDIGNEHITSDNQQDRDRNHEYMHCACVEYIRLSWNVKCIKWGMLKKAVNEFVTQTPNLYFDGPPWIISTVPWKEAKYGQWTAVSKKVRWLLKKEYTDGIRNRQEETSGVSTLQSEQPSFDG